MSQYTIIYKYGKSTRQLKIKRGAKKFSLKKQWRPAQIASHRELNEKEVIELLENAIPNKAVFSITPTWSVIPSFSIHQSNPFGDTSKGSYHYVYDFYHFEFPQSSDLSLQILVFYTFSFSFTATLTSAGTAMSIIIPFRFFLAITIMSSLLASIILSH